MRHKQYKSFGVLLSVVLMSANVAARAERDGPVKPCNDEFVPAPGSYSFIEEDTPPLDIDDGAVVGEIYYTRLPVFDESNPRENNPVYRFGNRFHILTTERTVARDILFEEGDPYRPRKISESARLLRSRDHLYDAAIRPVAVCDGQVDVEVITRDVWSFTPEISYDRSGGEDSVRLGIAEGNLLGTGREISFVADQGIDRDSLRFTYEDINLRGSHIRTKLQYTDSDDGFRQLIDLALPFYSLDTRNSWNVLFDKGKQDDAQFFRGEEVTEVRQEFEELQFGLGFSGGLRDGKTKRWRFGWTYRNERYTPTLDLPPPDPFPEDRELSYPFIEYSMIEDNYTTAFNLNEIHRTEDLHIGRSFAATLGYAETAFGSDQDRLIARFHYGDTLRYEGRNLLRHFLSFEGMYNLEENREEDVLLSYVLRYFRSRSTHRAFFALFEGVYSRNLNEHRQVVMGGLTGTRAFDDRFQIGDRRLHLTLEERQYTDLHILNLVRVGFAAFFDIGRAWEPGVDDGIEDDWLVNVGVGMRLASSKADVGSILHVDFAFPLTNRDDPLVDSLQIAINVKASL